MEIGKLVYESDDSTDITSKLQMICDEITELKASADDMQDSIDDLMNKKTCPYCSASVDKKHSFCPECGRGFDEE